jgi:hypothetical protein|tara:strand:- start:71 stop:532 length:462 start_codon:yes stop_codon:yes gene_type:complete
MARRLDLDISEKVAITTRRGDSFDVTLTFYIGEEAAGNEDDLQGDQFLMEVRDKASSDVNEGLIISSVGSNVIVTSASVLPASNFTMEISGSQNNDAGINNQLTIRCSAAEMELVASGRYVYDLQRYNTSSEEQKTILRGPFRVVEDVAEADN